ncbi:MAG TPA: (Fe-S)-binding protein [Kineosporiaceae bacterium]|nr:(Fe-S)-binding protein [Kineosporiaceae bacterium]
MQFISHQVSSLPAGPVRALPMLAAGGSPGLSGLQIGVVTLIAVLSVIGVALFGRTVGYLVRVFRLGQPDPTRGGQPGARLHSVLEESLGHARLGRWPLVGVMHWLVFVGFGGLFFTLLTAYGQVFDPTFALPLVGHFAPYEWFTELLGWSTLIAILVLIGIRQKNHPRSAAAQGRRSRFFGSSFWQAYYVEGTILVVGLCILTLRGLEYALAAAEGGQPGAVHFPLTSWLGGLFEGTGTASLKTAIVLVAALKIIVSMAWFITIAVQPTMGVAWHRFLAFVNIWFKRHPGRTEARGLPTSLGPLQPIRVKGEVLDFESVDELDEDAALGVGKVEDFTWKGLLDFSTCTECGRCQSQCPAWNTDKPLSPKLLVLNLRDHSHGKAPWLMAAEIDRTGLPADVLEEAQRSLVAPVDPDNPLTGGVIDPDVLWSCTTCGACVEQCPVDIEHVDHIVDMRRYQVLIESAFPSELGGLFKNLEKNANPWGMSPRTRMDWAKGLDFEIPQVGADVEDLTGVDYLFWIGCAGALEDRAKKTTRAVAELLHMAGVSFAVLGEGESCTGDPARRAGNEFLFQMLAQANVEMLNEARATNIVVTCAHCFNTLANEYPQLGGRYQVVHHTQLLNRLVREGRLTPVAPPSGSNGAGASVTYHDPCYLGRHNGVYTPPRELIGSLPGVQLAEMPRHGNRSFCCGAGGARMWMEEKLGTRINADRTAEAVATGAGTIAVGCPFCRVMLTDGLTTMQAGGQAPESVQVADVAQLLLEAVKRADSATEPATTA